MGNKTHKQSIIARLKQDPAYAVDYLNAAREADDVAGLRIALDNIAKAKDSDWFGQ